MEIERKYLVKTLPDYLDQYESKKIAQGYLCTEPVVRIRRSNDDYYLPQPVGPTMAMRWPGLTSRDRPSMSGRSGR